MSRKALKSGTTVTLNNRDYTINELMGTGATCLVYAASYDDDAGFKHIVRIKELYPYGFDIERREYNLIWNNDEEKNNSFSSFCDGYEKLMTNQQSNFVVHTFNMCEANGTKYIIMDANKGVTFDKDESTDITEILTTVKLLAEVVGRYHANGYLHLDIKPENFLVYPRPSDHIVLFDLDSVTSAEDIKNGFVTGISYSKGWAAPEQLKMDLGKICPATDIYAIGAVLFYKLMGRKVNNDDKGVFADWSFDDEMFLKVNPKLKFYLKKIFKKTLSANVKRRYQTISELLPDLDAAIETARYNAPYVVSNFNPSQSVFVGRENELMLISKELRNNRATFLSGLGGIGKTKLAEEFAFRCKNHFGTTVFLKYDRSMDNTIEEGDFSVENDTEISKRDALIRLLDEDDLIIIDNFDEIENIDDLNNFIDRQGIKASIIITTRITETALKDFNRTSITVETMPETDAWKLFVSHNDISYSDDDKKAIYMIFKEIENHTLTVELVAKYLRKTAQKPCELYDKLTEDGINAFSDARVVENKDGKSKKKTIEDHINTLFNLSSLTDSEKEMIYSLSLFGNIKISKELFLSWFYIEDKYDAFENLIDYGWVKESKNGKIHLHQLIIKTAHNQMIVSGAETINIFDGLSDYLDGYSNMNTGKKNNIDSICSSVINSLTKNANRSDIHVSRFVLKYFLVLLENGRTHPAEEIFLNDIFGCDALHSDVYRYEALKCFYRMYNGNTDDVDWKKEMDAMLLCYEKSIASFKTGVHRDAWDYEYEVACEIRENLAKISMLMEENVFDTAFSFILERMERYTQAIINSDASKSKKVKVCFEMLEFLPEENGENHGVMYSFPSQYCVKFVDEEKLKYYENLYKELNGDLIYLDYMRSFNPKLAEKTNWYNDEQNALEDNAAQLYERADYANAYKLYKKAKEYYTADNEDSLLMKYLLEGDCIKCVCQYSNEDCVLEEIRSYISDMTDYINYCKTINTATEMEGIISDISFEVYFLILDIFLKKEYYYCCQQLMNFLGLIIMGLQDGLYNNASDSDMNELQSRVYSALYMYNKTNSEANADNIFCWCKEYLDKADLFFLKNEDINHLCNIIISRLGNVDFETTE